MAQTQKVTDKPYCYSESELHKLSVLITDLQKCQAELVAKDRLINERLVLPEAAQAGQAWWQTPSFVVGGIVVSASAATILTWYLMHDK